MAAWFDPVLVLPAEQPPDTITVTLTLAEIEALLGKRLPLSARVHGWWLRRSPQAGYRRLLTPLGWTVGAVHRRRAVQAITLPWQTGARSVRRLGLPHQSPEPSL